MRVSVSSTLTDELFCCWSLLSIAGSGTVELLVGCVFLLELAGKPANSPDRRAAVLLVEAVLVVVLTLALPVGESFFRCSRERRE